MLTLRRSPHPRCPLSRQRRRLVLDIVRTDDTFHPADQRGRRVWAGRCIHCNTSLVVGADGELLGRGTVEHIIPRTHGGTDDLDNVALACARCNGGKGRRHDRRRWQDPGLQAMIARLQERRQDRWRDPGEAPGLW